LEILVNDQQTLVNGKAPFASLSYFGGRGGFDTIAFYRIGAGRTVAFRDGWSGASWADSKTCPALHDIANGFEAAKTPPLPTEGRDRVICTADCPTYRLTFNTGTDENFTPSEFVDNDNVWPLFERARKLQGCWQGGVPD
jgi:hypothetical protein